MTNVKEKKKFGLLKLLLIVLALIVGYVGVQETRSFLYLKNMDFEGMRSCSTNVYLLSQAARSLKLNYAAGMAETALSENRLEDADSIVENTYLNVYNPNVYYSVKFARAEQLLRSGGLEAGFAALEDMRYFSDSQKQTIAALASELADAGNHDDARKLLKYAGNTAGVSELKDRMLLTEADAKAAAGEYPEAISLLKDVSDKSLSAPKINAANLALGRKAAEEEQWGTASNYADKLTEPFTDEEQAFRTEVYRRAGITALENIKFYDAAAAFNKCGTDTASTALYAISNALSGKDIAAVEEAIQQNFIPELGGLSGGQWEEILYHYGQNSLRTNTDSSESYLLSVEKQLRLSRLIATVNPCGTAPEEIAAALAFFSGSIHSSLDKNEPAYSDSMLAACGTDPQGKILLLREITVYGSKEKSYSPATGLMSKLPADLIPEKLEQVSYILIARSDYSVSKEYSGTVRFPNGTTAPIDCKGIRQSGSILIQDPVHNTAIFRSNTQYGTQPPSKYESNSTPPKFISGDSPVLTKEIENALKTILK